VLRPVTSSPSLRDDQAFAAPRADETLIADTRVGVTPAQMVERKLAGLLKTNPLLISHAQLRGGSLSRRVAEG
jgi:hypothetical protein